MKRGLIKLAVALLTALSCSVTWSQGWGAILRNSPVEDYNDEDLRRFLDTVKQALDAPAPPQPVEFSNPATGAGGTVLVIGTPKMKNFDECKRVRAAVHSKRRKAMPTVWTSCKETTGRWVLVSAK